MKTYRNHKCDRQHRNARTFIRCAIPRHFWIRGEGDIALIAWCDQPSITLWGTEEDARASLDFIDDWGCGHKCRKRHDIVRIEVGA